MHAIHTTLISKKKEIQNHPCNASPLINAIFHIYPCDAFTIIYIYIYIKVVNIHNYIVFGINFIVYSPVKVKYIYIYI
jgi:hypothetical protein